MTSGGSYRLTVLAWKVSGSASGGGYHLLSPVAPSLRGSGCCCTKLPLILRNVPYRSIRRDPARWHVTRMAPRGHMHRRCEVLGGKVM